MDDELVAVAQRLDDPRQSEAEWGTLLRASDAIERMKALLPRLRTWQARTALVFHAVRHARDRQEAFEIGVAALRDRSYMVRYRACGVLAYSLREDAVEHLASLTTHRDVRTVEDVTAAIDAIRSRNHHYFVDRGHTGRSFWHVRDGDSPLP